MDCQVGEQSKGRKEGQTASSFLHHLESTFPVGVPAGPRGKDGRKPSVHPGAGHVPSLSAASLGNRS